MRCPTPMPKCPVATEWVPRKQSRTSSPPFRYGERQYLTSPSPGPIWLWLRMRGMRGRRKQGKGLRLLKCLPHARLFVGNISWTLHNSLTGKTVLLSPFYR